jgi:hypothetical protein
VVTLAAALDIRQSRHRLARVPSCLAPRPLPCSVVHLKNPHLRSHHHTSSRAVLGRTTVIHPNPKYFSVFCSSSLVRMDKVEGLMKNLKLSEVEKKSPKIDWACGGRKGSRDP